MKKTTAKLWMAWLMVLVLAVFSLAGCGQNGESSETADISTMAGTAESASAETAESVPADTSETEMTSAAETAGNQATAAWAGSMVFDHALKLEYAENFQADYYQDGYVLFTAGAEQQPYLVVPEGQSVPEGIPEEVTVLQMPLDRILLSSTGMCSLFSAIGALDHVKLVTTEADDWYINDVKNRMEDGSIQYTGEYDEPDFEQVTAENIQLVIETTMINGSPDVLEKYEELGIPTLVETSSQENHPLGRVEWVKLWGILCGMEEEAEAYFAEQKTMVESLAEEEKSDVSVAMFYASSSRGTCYVRNGGDYMAKMIELAGGNYLQEDLNPDESGTAKMSFEELYASIQDVDYIFYINLSDKYYSLADMTAGNELFGSCKAVQNGHVWYTSQDFIQSTAAIGSIIQDMHTIFTSDGTATTDHLIRME